MDLIWVSLDSSLRDYETQKFVGGYPKGTLGRIQLHAVLSVCGKGLMEVPNMVGHIYAFDHHVIDVGLHILPDLVSEDLIDHPLIGGSDVLQPEGHYFITVSPSIGDEGYFVFSIGCHPDLIIFEKGIHEGHEPESQSRIHELIYAGKGIAIFGTSLVQVDKVDAHSPLSGWLFDEDHIR